MKYKLILKRINNWPSLTKAFIVTDVAGNQYYKVKSDIAILGTQTLYLYDFNNNKLGRIDHNRESDYKETKDALKQSKRFNVIMMVISAIAMLAAIARPIVTILVSK